MTTPMNPSPGPDIPSLQAEVEDLRRRLSALERRPGATPGATAVQLAAYPYSDTQATRVWPGTAGTSFRPLYTWIQQMEWRTFDVGIYTYIPSGATAQLQIVMDDTVTIWTSQPLASSQSYVRATLDLTGLLDDPGQSGVTGAPHKMVLQGLTSTGTLYVLIERLLVSDPMWT